MTEQVQELDRKDLKILAYKQKLSEADERFADLQVEHAILSEQLQNVFKEYTRLKETYEPEEEPEKPVEAD